jgi:hypothetical protein
MDITFIRDGCFDDKALAAMGIVFDQACCSLGHVARDEKVREILAKRIVEAARSGELDPIRLHSRAIIGFGAN